MNRLEQFASEHKLRLRKDECWDLMVSAKLGHIYEHGPGVLGVVLSESDRYSNKILLARRRQLVKAGLTLHQVGDAKSILLFDPTNTIQAKAVIRAVGALKRHKQTARQLSNLKKSPEKMPLQAPGNAAMVLDGPISHPFNLGAQIPLIPLNDSRSNRPMNTAVNDTPFEAIPTLAFV